MQAIISIFGVPGYIAPGPVEVVMTFVEKADILWLNFWPTLFEALSGFFLGNGIAIWFVHNQLAECTFYPVAVFINTIPIIAVAPILVLIFGSKRSPRRRQD